MAVMDRPREEVEVAPVLEVARRHGDREHADRGDQPRAQLIEMLDQRQLVVGCQSAEACHLRSGVRRAGRVDCRRMGGV